MKIEKIEYEIIKLPLKTPFKTALRSAYDVGIVRLRVACQGGVFALGEAPATKAITGEGLEEIVASILTLRSSLEGLSPQEALAIVHESAIGSSAKAAFDMACTGLLALQNDQPLQIYFGVVAKTPIQTALTISYNDTATMVRHAKESYDAGMGILKLKFAQDVQHAIETTHAIAKALPQAKLLIDPNQAWSVTQSLEYLKNIADVKIELLEQPVAANDITALKQIKEATHIPVVADEAVFSLEDAKRVMGAKSADMFNIKLMKCGGVTKAIELLEYARKENIGVMLGSMLEGAVSINYALYLAFAYRDVVRFVDLDSPLLLAHMPKELDFIYEGCAVRFG